MEYTTKMKRENEVLIKVYWIGLVLLNRFQPTVVSTRALFDSYIINSIPKTPNTTEHNPYQARTQFYRVCNGLCAAVCKLNLVLYVEKDTLRLWKFHTSILRPKTHARLTEKNKLVSTLKHYITKHVSYRKIKTPF